MSALVFERKFDCSGQLDFGFVGVVGRGLLVMTRIGDDTLNLWFFPPTVFLDLFLHGHK